MDAKKINVAFSFLARVCVRACIDRKTLDARRGKENNHLWVRNNKSKLAKPLSIRFPRSNHRGEEMLVYATFSGTR